MAVKRLFIDWSHLYRHRGGRGIDRVVKNILAYSSGTGVVWLDDGNFYSSLYQDQEKQFLLAEVFRGFISKLFLTAVVILGFLLPRFLYLFLRFLYRWARESLRSLRYQKVSFTTGDVLFIPDANWRLPNEYLQSLKQLKKQGVRIVVLVYDLVPINAPEYLSFAAALEFGRWIRSILPLADFCLTISRATKRELEVFSKSIGCQVRAFAIHLGFDLRRDRGREEEDVRGELFPIFSPGNPYVVVGALEPRKNNGAILEAFNTLWRKGVKAKLIFIGKVTPDAEEFYQRLSSHKQWKKLLFVFQDLSDVELSFCYSHAKALVMASFYEGFGLPVVEALHYGLPVFASNIPPHKEVGGNFVAFFDPVSPKELAKLIYDFEKTGRYPAKRISPFKFSWPTWKESVAKMVATIAAHNR